MRRHMCIYYETCFKLIDIRFSKNMIFKKLLAANVGNIKKSYIVTNK